MHSFGHSTFVIFVHLVVNFFGCGFAALRILWLKFFGFASQLNNPHRLAIFRSLKKKDEYEKIDTFRNHTFRRAFGVFR